LHTALADFLRQETTGGKLLLLATAIALLWANLAEPAYMAVWSTELAVGPQWLHLDLELSDWASEGLLAIFFFVAGMEVKRELTVGELAERRAAALPVFAAVGGMLVPALVATAVSGGAAASDGAWAIPVATDIAFALGVLAVVGSSLPSGVRVLLLSMAVIDDLLAIILIAVLFTSGLQVVWLAASFVPFAAFAMLLRRGHTPVTMLWVLALAAWVCVHASGVHATVAGIILGLLVPVTQHAGARGSFSERFEHRLHPLSAGFVVPIFALAAAGIPLAAAADAITQPVAIGIVAGLVIGKPVGILAGAWLAERAGVGVLPDEVLWADVVPVAVLGGIGYTVSLLIAGLAFDQTALAETSGAAVLIGSALASAIAITLLRLRPTVVERSQAPRGDP
jgi:Na+:H+ antiporter, NhaA family